MSRSMVGFAHSFAACAGLCASMTLSDRMARAWLYHIVQQRVVLMSNRMARQRRNKASTHRCREHTSQHKTNLS